MNYSEIIKKLNSMANAKNVEGMKRFGIRGSKVMLGISIPDLRNLGKQIGKNHELALKLWDSGIHEARLLSCFIDELKSIDEKQMEKWVNSFDSWDLCDQCCSNLFDKTSFVHKKIKEWVKSEKEFVRRAGFVLMACLAVHDKKLSDSEFTKFFPTIKKYSTDERNFVRKAVNWALRQIGKRNESLRKAAIKVGKEIEKIDSKSARWVAKDALRELESKKFKS